MRSTGQLFAVERFGSHDLPASWSCQLQTSFAIATGLCQHSLRVNKKKLLRGSHIENMLLEDQRFIHEDLERLEQAIADRVAEEPRNVSVAPSNVSYVF